MPFTTFCFVCFYQPTFCRVCMFINKQIKNLILKVSLPEATIFFKHTLWLNVQNCLRGKTFLALEVSTMSQSITKKCYSRSQTSESNVKQAETETRCALSVLTNGVSRPQLKTQTQVRASQMQSYVTRAPAVVF